MDEIKNDDVFPAGIQSSGQMIRNLNWRLLESERENARLRTELTQAKEMALAATAETAMVRNSLKLVLNEHDKECTELERTIARQVVLIHEQARMIATAAEQSRKDQAPVKAIEHADWTPPAGLPRGMR